MAAFRWWFILCQFGLSLGCFSQGRSILFSGFDTAIETFDQSKFLDAEFLVSEVISAHEGDTCIAAEGNIWLGKINQYQADYEPCITYYTKGYNMALRCGDPNLIFWATVSLAEFHRWNYKFDAALQKISEAEAQLFLPEVSNNLKGYFFDRKAAIMSQAGYTWPEVVEVVQKAIDIFSAESDSINLASAYNQYAFYAAIPGSEKIRLWNLSASIFESSGSIKDYFMVQVNLIRSLLLKDSITKAFDRIDKCLSICETDTLEYLEDIPRFLDFKLTHYKNTNQYKNIVWVQGQLDIFKKLIDQRKFSNRIWELQSQSELALRKSKIEQEIKANRIATKNLALERENSKLLTWLLTGAIIAIGIFIYVLFRFWKLNRKKQGLLKEKEHLLKEVHHRVKNNLQNLSSLLNLQLESAKSTRDKEILTQIVGRLDTISLTHHLLYADNDVNVVNMKKYIHQLFQQIVLGNSNDGNTITHSINVESVDIKFEKAVAVGMIINELVLNSLKYAPSQQALNISLDIDTENRDEEILVFNYADNNSAFSETKPTTRNKSTQFGLQIIAIFKQGLEIEELTKKVPFQEHFRFSIG